MKVKYLGDSFGADSLTDGQIYECLGVEGDFIRIIDDSGEDYLYPAKNPALMGGEDKKGKWSIVPDAAFLALQAAIA